MTDTFNPSEYFAAYRNAFAPLMQAQEAALKSIEQIARFQYAVAGDILESGLAQLHGVTDAKSPTELLAKQSEVGALLGVKLRARTQELANFAAQAQGSFADFVSSATQKVAETTQGAAKTARKKAA
jgi:hypothetical protein